MAAENPSLLFSGLGHSHRPTSSSLPLHKAKRSTLLSSTRVAPTPSSITAQRYTTSSSENLRHPANGNRLSSIRNENHTPASQPKIHSHLQQPPWGAGPGIPRSAKIIAWEEEPSPKQSKLPRVASLANAPLKTQEKKITPLKPTVAENSTLSESERESISAWNEEVSQATHDSAYNSQPAEANEERQEDISCDISTQTENNAVIQTQASDSLSIIPALKQRRLPSTEGKVRYNSEASHRSTHLAQHQKLMHPVTPNTGQRAIKKRQLPPLPERNPSGLSAPVYSEETFEIGGKQQYTVRSFSEHNGHSRLIKVSFPVRKPISSIQVTEPQLLTSERNNFEPIAAAVEEIPKPITTTRRVSFAPEISSDPLPKVLSASIQQPLALPQLKKSEQLIERTQVAIATKDFCKADGNFINVGIAASQLKSATEQDKPSPYDVHASTSDAHAVAGTSSVGFLEHLVGAAANIHSAREAKREIAELNCIISSDSSSELAKKIATENLGDVKTERKLAIAAATRYSLQAIAGSGLTLVRAGLDSNQAISAGTSTAINTVSGAVVGFVAAPIAIGLSAYGVVENRKQGIKSGGIKTIAREQQKIAHLIEDKTLEILARLIKRKQSPWKKWTAFIANIFNVAGYSLLGASGIMTFAVGISSVAGVAAIPFVGWAIAGVAATLLLGLAIHRLIKYRQHRNQKIELLARFNNPDNDENSQARIQEERIALSAKDMLNYLTLRFKSGMIAENKLNEKDEAFLKAFKLSDEEITMICTSLGNNEDITVQKFLAKRFNLGVKIKNPQTTRRRQSLRATSSRT